MRDGRDGACRAVVCLREGLGRVATLYDRFCSLGAEWLLDNGFAAHEVEAIWGGRTTSALLLNANLGSRKRGIEATCFEGAIMN